MSVQVRKLQGLIKAHSIFNAMMATPGKGEITALELEVRKLPEMSAVEVIGVCEMTPLPNAVATKDPQTRFMLLRCMEIKLKYGESWNQSRGCSCMQDQACLIRETVCIC